MLLLFTTAYGIDGWKTAFRYSERACSEQARRYWAGKWFRAL